MVLSWTALVAAGLGARVLMIAVLAMSVLIMNANRSTKYDYQSAGYNIKLQSYSYAVAAAVFGMAGSLLQILVPVYLFCTGKRRMLSILILNISMYTDIVVTVALASGVGAGFGATNDVVEYTKHASKWGDDVRQDLIRYYQRGSVGIVFLLIGMILSVCATVISASLRARATNEPAGV
ncbi:hypothetical protein ACP4OV_005917 [Aristida adscensionis]